MKIKTKAFWIRQLYQWHWISAAISLVAILVFSFTGITLNHAADIPATPTVVTKEAVMPSSLLSQLDEGATNETASQWLRQQLHISPAWQHAEWEDDEVYIDLPRPGGDAWLTIDRESGEVFYESTYRGWISWLNDLHKGRNTGKAWSWFIDIFAVACLIFSITGLVLLQIHSKHRPSTWPLVGAGLLVPVLLLLFFVHA